MKNLAMIMGVLALSTSAFAGQSDLELFNTLKSAGIQTDQFMSQIHIGLDNVQCIKRLQAASSTCILTDLTAMERKDTGSATFLNGQPAEALFNFVAANAANKDENSIRIIAKAKSIRCSQAVEGVMDGSEADRTACAIVEP